MHKYQFRLENVRRVRRLQEEAAKSVLAAANMQVQLAHEAVLTAEAHYQSACGQTPLASGADAFLQQRYSVELAGQAVIAARRNKAVMESERLLAHRGWAEAAQRLKALDRLDERAREEYRIEFDRHVDREMDEINVGRAARPVTA